MGGVEERDIKKRVPHYLTKMESGISIGTNKSILVTKFSTHFTCVNIEMRKAGRKGTCAERHANR